MSFDREETKFSRYLPEIALIVILCLLATLPYVNILHNRFVYDDESQVLANPYLQNFHHLRQIFSSTVWSYFGGAEGKTNYFRPLMLLAFLLCYRVFGPLPLGFHLVSLGLNAAVVVVLFKISKRLFRDRTQAFLVAALFALHPIHTEAVDWISALPDLEVALFCLLAFWIYVNMPEPNLKPRLWSQIVMGLTFALALLSKESAATLPAVATTFEHFYREDRAQTDWRRKLSRYGVLWGLDAFYVAYRIRVLGAFLPAPTIVEHATYGDAVLGLVPLLGQYVWKFLWPIKLCAYYVFKDQMANLPLALGGGLAILGLTAWVYALLYRRARIVSFGILWFLITLAPVLNAHWMPESVFAERYLYLPSVGLCWVAGWALKRLAETAASRPPVWRRAVVAGLVILGALGAARIVIRNRDWSNNIAFYTSVLEVSPHAYEMRTNLGALYYNLGFTKEAEKEWLLAREEAPTNVSILDDLSLIYMDEGRYDEALGVLYQSLMRVPNSVETHVKLALTFSKMGDRQRAEHEYRAALELSPLSVPAQNGLGELYTDEGRYQDAVEQFNRSLQAVPTTEAYLRGAVAYWQLGDLEHAESYFKKAEALTPDESRAYFALGLFYDLHGRKSEALQEYQKGFKIDPDNQVARAAIEKLESEKAKAGSK